MRGAIVSLTLGLLLSACAQPRVLRQSVRAAAAPPAAVATTAEPVRMYEAAVSIADAPPHSAKAWCLSPTRSYVPRATTTSSVPPTTTRSWRHASTATQCQPACAKQAADAPDLEAEALRYARCLAWGRRKSTYLTIGVCGAVLAYGAIFWNYGSNEFNFQNDGWFEEDTDYGGADKVGHMVAARVMTAIFAGLNRSWCIPPKEAALRAALTTFTYMSVMEFGDGFTKVHGFTYGDVVANGIGCLFGYLEETWPWFNRVFDLRWEYFPTNQVWSGEDLDITTDYEGSAYLLAVNTGALITPRRHVLDLVDLQVGYYTRHYQDLEAPPERHVFAGVGLNLATAFRWLRLPGFAKVFEYWQPPGISLRMDWEL